MFVCLSDCLFVCLHISKTTRLNIPRKFHMAEARFSFDSKTIRYVLLVLWMVLCFVGQKLMPCVSSNLPGGITGGEVCRFYLHLVIPYFIQSVSSLHSNSKPSLSAVTATTTGLCLTDLNFSRISIHVGPKPNILSIFTGWVFSLSPN